MNLRRFGEKTNKLLENEVKKNKKRKYFFTFCKLIINRLTESTLDEEEQSKEQQTKKKNSRKSFRRKRISVDRAENEKE
jgi:hypothetical protein